MDGEQLETKREEVACVGKTKRELAWGCQDIYRPEAALAAALQ